MTGKTFSPSFLEHMNQANLLVLIGLLFSQTLLLPYLTSLAGNQQISKTLLITFCISTILLLVCVSAYICKEIYYQFINIYEFFIFPIFTMLTINQLNCKSSFYLLIISVILLCFGGAVCILNIIYFYSRKVINKNNNILRVSINYRLVRIIRFAIFIFLYVVNPQSIYVFVCISFSILSIINIYYSISKFSFQSVYQQFLTLVFSIASFISSIQGLASTQSYTRYTFLGELIAIGIIIFEPSIMIDFLQLKYGYFMTKNIQMRNQHQMLAVFKIMKQILVKKSKQFEYSPKFKKKVYLSYQKMLHKSKKMFKSIGYYNRYLEEGDNKNSSSVGSMFNFAAINSILQEEDVFYNLIHVRLMKSEDFFIWEFYIISQINYKYRNFNKSISQFYKKRLQEKKRNFLDIISENILYENIMKFIPFKQNQYRQHLSIKFYKQFKELTNDINKICKNQTQIISMMKNSSSVSITKYTKILCLRSQLKQKINQQIQKMTDFSFYIFSNNFLYTVLLYKLFFQRQQKVMRQKIMNLFVKKLASVTKQNEIFLQFQKKSIVVCSAIANGEILQSNQKFQKTYQPMSLKKKINTQKLYISDILLNKEQKQKHQKLFAKASLFHQSKQQHKEHKDYTCYIYRYLKFNFQNYNQKQKQMNEFIKVVDKVRISTRIYFCIRQEFNYICMIERISQNIEYGYRVLGQEINSLQKKGLYPKIIKSQAIIQLDKQFQSFIIGLKQLQYCEEQIDQNQDLEANCSQQFNFDEKQELEEQKTNKIQKSFNQQKQTIYRPQIIFVSAFILCMIIYVSFIFWYQNYKDNQLEKTYQFIKLCQKVIQNLLLTEQIVGLQMILYHYFSQTNQNKLCQQYTNVENMTKYLQDQLLNYANTKFSQAQRMYIMINFQQPLLINDLTSKSYSWYDASTLVNQIHMDYFKFVAFTKNFIFDYARPFQQPKQDFKTNFQNIVQQMINQNHLNKSQEFYQSIKNSFLQDSQELQTLYNLSNFFVTAFAIIVFVGIILILSKLISHQKSHLMLLKSLNKQYFTKRMKQTKFISSQLAKIQNSSYERIEINRNMRIKIYKWNSIEQYTFQQIQHMGQLQTKQKNQQKNQQIQDKHQNEKIGLLSKSGVSNAAGTNNNLSKITLNISIAKSFLNLKFPLILISLLFFTILGLHTYDNIILQTKIANNLHYYDVVGNLNKVQYSMAEIIRAQWLFYINEPKYKTPQIYIEEFNGAIHQLNTSNYIQDIRTTFDKDSSFDILYKSYCDGLDIEQTANCQQFNKGALTQGLAFLASMIVNDGVKSLSMKDSFPNLFKQEICSKLVIFLNYTIDKFGDQLSKSYQSLDAKTQNIQTKIIIGMIFLTIALLISSFFLVFHLYKTCKKTRTQVLSMQSKAVLYEKYQDFRPFLNQIYYRKDE